MGFNRPQWKFLNKSFRETGLLSKNYLLPKNNNLPIAGTKHPSENYYGKNMLELGCQEIRKAVKNKLNYGGMAARGYFKSIGINCISIDKSSCHRAVVTDLKKPIRKEYINNFDIITNSGTTEHVKPFDGQYMSFKNIHDCAKIGGVIIHILPGIGEYYGHCQTYYDYDFFRMLAKYNNYELVLMDDVKKRSKFVWVGVCFVKKEDREFMIDKKKFFKHLEWIDKKIYKKHQTHKSKYMY